jgi:SAM-dependent methyltransferase
VALRDDRNLADISLRCVECGTAGLQRTINSLSCVACSVSYPLFNECPVLLKSDSIFALGNTGAEKSAGMPSGGVWSLRRFLPSATFTHFAASAKFRAIARHGGKQRACLIIGAGENQAEAEALNDAFGLAVVTDVAWHKGVDYICDGHDLPFADDTFDFVMLTAVLEHVLTPAQVVSEISRVLKKGGIVYAVTPFMQQVHMGAFDFQRFTDLGHRWLFREFNELERGTCGGPASSLLWSMIYFAAAFSSNRKLSKLLGLFARLGLFWIKYLDFFLERRATARDGANGFYFVGQNAKGPALSSHDLLAQYVGGRR